MVAEVYPIMRMPRHVTVFDYAIPETLSDLKRGDLVVIPFRNKSVYGIISRVKEVSNTTYKLKSILQHDDRLVFADAEINFFESLALELVQSVSSVLYSSLPEIPKRQTIKKISSPISKPLTIPSAEQEGLQAIAEQLQERKQAFATVSDIRRMTCVIAGFMRLKPEQKCIVLCPTVLDAQRISTYLPIENRFLFTGDENAGTQFATWHAYKNCLSGVMIGTKNVLFATDEKTTTIFVVRSSHDNHGHHEQNPRFDARIVSQMLSKHFQKNLYFLDVMPRIDDIQFFSMDNMLGLQNSASLRLIDMEQQGRVSPMGHWISHETFLAIQDLLEQKKRILLVFNKKNQAKRLFCTVCETDIACLECGNSIIIDDQSMRCARCKRTEPIIRTCPKCAQPTLKESGFGNQKVDTLLRAAFPNTTTCLIDKEHSTLNKQAQIVIATSFYLEQIANAFQPDLFDLVVLLDADAPLYRNTYRASESALYGAEEWRALAEANHAQFFLQSRSIPFFTEFYTDTKKTIENELEARRSYIQPPFCEMISIRFQESNQQKADVLQNHLIQQIRLCSSMARMKKGKTLHTSEHLLELRFPKEDRESLLRLFRTIPDHVMIDTHAKTG